MSGDSITPKITTLPGQPMTPVSMLARLLERAKAGEVVSIMVSAEYHDGMFGGSYTAMQPGTAFCHARTAQQLADDAFYGSDEVEILDDGSGDG